MKNKFIGTGVALITPFLENGTVDYLALERLVEFQIDNGIDYLVVMGTTGEPATLKKEEKELVISKIIEVNNQRLPLVLGIGGNCTQQVVDELNEYNLEGFDAILSVSPYYNKPTQKGIFKHFKAISKATDKDIIIYNVPHRTGQNMVPKTILKLAKECKNIIAIKDAASDILQTFELIKNKPKDFLIISGDDSLALPSILAGAVGVISVLGQGMPKEFTKMIDYGLQGETKKAFAIHYDLMHITNLIFKEGNPAGIKTILNYKEICGDEVRLPLMKASKKLQKLIVKAIDS